MNLFEYKVELLVSGNKLDTTHWAPSLDVAKKEINEIVGLELISIHPTGNKLFLD